MFTRLSQVSVRFLLLVCLLALMQPVAAQDQTGTPSGCTPPAGWHQYTVQAGDTLSRLAREYGATVRVIARANCLMYQVQVGQEIFLPVVGPNPEADDSLRQREQLRQGQPALNPGTDQDRDQLRERDHDQDCSQDCNPDQDRTQDRDRKGHK